MVAGVAALCVNREPSLANEPQALKAMVMVSGLSHNVEGKTSLSDKDGAGAATATAVCCGFYVRTVRSADFDANGLFEVPIDIGLNPRDLKRIVLVYTHPPTSNAPEDPAAVHDSYLRSDIDLELHVDGRRVAESSTGSRNPFEIIDYLPSASVKARVKLRRVDWNSRVSSLRIAVAYASRSTLGASPEPSDESDGPDLDHIVHRWSELSDEDRSHIWDAIQKMTSNDEGKQSR